MKSRAASAKDGGKAEGRTHGRLAREGREGGRRRNRGRRPGQGLGERGETSNGAPAADTRNTRGLSHRRAPTPARRRSPQNVFPEDDGAERAPRRTSARPDRTPTGRRTTAKSLFPSQGPTRAVPSRTHRPPKNTPRRPRSPRSRGDLQLLTRLPSGSRTAADARARACPAIPPNGGSGSAAGSADRGEPTADGEGERHSRTRASGGRGDGNGPRKAPHPGPRETTDPSDDRATRANRRESHRPKTPPEAVPPPNQRSQAGPKPTAPPPGAREDPTRETTNAAATAEDPRAGSGAPAHVQRHAGHDRPSFPKGRIRERSQSVPPDPEHPGPVEGKVTDDPQTWERCRVEEDEAALHRRHKHERHARVDAQRHVRAAGTAITGTRGRGRSRRAGTAGPRGRRVGPGSPPPPYRSPAGPRPAAALGEAGHRGTRACTHGPPSPSPHHGKSHVAPSDTGVTTTALPRVIPLGLGARRRGPRLTRERSTDARGEATRIGRSGRAAGRVGGPRGREPQQPESDTARPFLGSLEKALFSLRAGRTRPDEPPAAAAKSGACLRARRGGLRYR